MKKLLNVNAGMLAAMLAGTVGAACLAGGVQMKEFPIPFHSVMGQHIVFNGGGYFRLMPYGIIRKWTQECGEYCLSYIHPRDLDAEQPMLEGLPLTRKFKSYVGLRGAETKLRKYLTDFEFTDICTAAAGIDWVMAPVVKL